MKRIQLILSYSVIILLIVAFAGCASTSTRDSTGEYFDDAVITTKVKTLLAADDFLKSFQISVDTHDGIVQLSGHVNNQEAVHKAVEIARSVQGVRSVKNDLIVK
ncbi:BON domain-containing protein [Desulfonatronum thioautotrophicum]|uniref:BON domain-containing protein n=1 Tax=Desulfonatronum thioautotrophicum TaxID=617001 RepID=UPI0005EB32AE|nr:BON domain-containing protein [Desulfonatronum thioautotrophicum]